MLGIYPASTEAGHYANLKGNAVLKYAEGNCIGTLFFGVEIGLLDDDGEEVPMGEVGEIFARSSFQYEGCYNDPALTDSTRRVMFVTEPPRKLSGPVMQEKLKKMMLDMKGHWS